MPDALFPAGSAWEPNQMASPGQLVLITDNGGGDSFYRVGARATLTRYDSVHWWARFRDGAEWCIGVENENFTQVGILGATLSTHFMPLEEFRAPSIDWQSNADNAIAKGDANPSSTRPSPVATYWWATFASGAWCISVESTQLTGTPGIARGQRPVRLRERLRSILARSLRRGTEDTTLRAK